MGELSHCPSVASEIRIAALHQRTPTFPHRLGRIMQQLFEMSGKLRGRAHRIIPGGCHTYAKGDDQYPITAPSFIVRGLGCHVWDVDGNEFIEYGMGNRAVTLGHAFPYVLEAVTTELGRGSNFTRPSPIEVACAEEFLDL